MIFRKPKPIRAEAAATIKASENGPATFDASPAYSGGILKVSGYRFGVILDLSGLSVNKKVVANLDHDSRKRVGHITDHSNDGKSLSLSGVMSADTAHTREILGSHDQGFEWDVSIEAVPNGKPEMIEAGKTVFVNGQTFKGPVEVARKSTLFGLGFVTMGADSQNHVAIAAEEIPPGEEEPEETTEQTFESWAKSHQFDIESMSDQEIEALTLIFEKQSKASEPVEAYFDANFIRAELQKTESKIEAACLQYEDSIPGDKIAAIKAEAQDKLRALRAKAGEHEYTRVKFRFEASPIIAQARLSLIRAERPQGPSIVSSTRDKIMDSKLIEAHFVRKIAGEAAAIRFFGERVVEAERKSGLASVHDICKAINLQNGNVTHEGPQATITNAMRPIFASGPSNINLPTLLSNVANKVALLGYEEQPSAIFDIAEVKSVRDFKDATDIRMSAGENLEQLAPGGQIKHGTLSEESVFTRKVETYAQMRVIDRRDLLNDDLRAFDQLQKVDGAAAKRTLVNLFWRVWMTGAGSFWNASNNNLLTTGTALSIANLGKGISALRKQVDSKGNVLDMMPTFLIVPPELESTAKPIVNSATVIGASSVTPDGNPMFNIVQGVITEPRLSNAGYTNNSTAAWYLTAQKSAGAIVISFLEGKDSPPVETEIADFNRLGLQMRVYHDFGVSLGDPKAAFKATGAA